MYKFIFLISILINSTTQGQYYFNKTFDTREERKPEAYTGVFNKFDEIYVIGSPITFNTPFILITDMTGNPIDTFK